MDYWHVMKQNKKQHFQRRYLFATCYLQLDSYSILWEHWYKAYQWDFIPINSNFTQDHFFVNSQLKMRKQTCRRCHEPRYVLHLMECYQKFLEDEENLSIGIDALSGLLQLVNGAMFQGTRLTVWYIWNSDWRRRTQLLVLFPLFLFQLDFVQAENYLISQLKVCIYYFGLQYLKSSKKLQDVLFWSCNWEGGWGDQMRI